ncbi:MAG: RraA family protein [Chloroflexota bacterium]
MHIENPVEIVQNLTREWQGNRCPKGRPIVSDDLLERMKLVTHEEAWAVLQKHGYHLQFEGTWIVTHPNKVLVGRAFTAMMVPLRPDLDNLVQQLGKAQGRVGRQNSWVLDLLENNDVLVVDLFGKVKEGTYIGDNLATSIGTRTNAGAVFDGGIRDFEAICKMTNVAIFCRGYDPAEMTETTLAGINIPIRINHTTVLPGDVVLGTVTGITFIPAHLAQEVVETSEDIRVRDIFGKLRLSEGKYTPGEIDVDTWAAPVESDYQDWLINYNSRG